MKKMNIFILLLFINFFMDANERESIFIKSQENTIVYCIDDGKVLNMSYSEDLGLHITVEYLNTGMIITYCNLKTSYVAKKQIIKKGGKLGKIGMTGNVIEPGITVIIELNEKRFLYNEDE